MSETLYLFPLLSKTRSILFPHTYNRLYDRSLSRRAPVDQTRLVKHSFLHCLRYAAQRHVLLTSAANILGETCSSSSDARKLNFLLYGVWSVNCNVNRAFFSQSIKVL